MAFKASSTARRNSISCMYDSKSLSARVSSSQRHSATDRNARVVNPVTANDVVEGYFLDDVENREEEEEEEAENGQLHDRCHFFSVVFVVSPEPGRRWRRGRRGAMREFPDHP